MLQRTESFDTVADAIEAIANGEFVIVVDDTDRENEGDLIIAAEKITTEKMAFLVRHSSGLVCVAMQAQRLQALDLPQMVTENADPFRTAFTVSVDYKYGTTSGISAADRALTLRALADPASQAGDFHRPGHLFPLRARLGGVLERPGHTEAAHDLAVLAGLQPVGVLCEIVNEDGSMARRPDLLRFAKQHGLKIITIADMIAYRERQVELAYPALRQPSPLPLSRPLRQQSALLDAAMVYSG
jgi:3,4-dihydroxy 2-butanone 4-phosphate synthase/GTP cyclohydrolase II